MSQTLAQEDKPERSLIWLQLLRRMVLLLIAFALALLLIRLLRAPLFALFPAREKPATETILERLPNTLLLLGAAMLVASLLAPILALAGVLIHKLEEKTGPVGSALKGVGRLCAFAKATFPAFCAGIVLRYVYFFKFRLLPSGGMYSINVTGKNLGDLLAHLILPTLALALLPATLAAQVMARSVTLARVQSGWRVWLAGLCKGLGVLFSQVGGLLSALVLVERIFAWPGLGRLVGETVARLDLPVLWSSLNAFAIIVLVGQFISELLYGLERLIDVPPLRPQPEPTHWRRTARTAWTAAALLLLLIPLALSVAGLATRSEAAIRADATIRVAAPSADHPLGTDSLGRDILARLLRGTLVTLSIAVLTTLILFLPSGAWGALAGFLAAKKSLWAESVADLLLLPIHVLLLIPALPGAMALALALIKPFREIEISWLGAGLACLIMLFPRATLACQAFWTSAPERRKWLALALAGSGALLLGSMFATAWLIAALDFAGLGVRPPTPALGILVGESLALPARMPTAALAPTIVLGICTFALYTAADALVGFFDSKMPIAQFNE